MLRQCEMITFHLFFLPYLAYFSLVSSSFLDSNKKNWNDKSRTFFLSIFIFSNSLEMYAQWRQEYMVNEWIEKHFISFHFIFFYRQLQSNGTLEFPAFSSQFYRSDIHDQVYRCQAMNQAGSIISRNIHVRGIIHQFYDVKIDGTDVYLNNVAFLRCSIPQHMREFVEVTTWFRGEEALTENSDISE